GPQGFSDRGARPLLRLEAQPQPELELAGTRGLVGPPHFARGLSERSRIRCEVARLAKLNPIEQVIGLCAELQSQALGKLRGFLQDQVPVVNSGTPEVVST